MSWYGMNEAMVELRIADNREAFTADPDGYLTRFDLNDRERAAIKQKDVLALWDLGAQPYILRGFQRRTGIPDEDFNQALQDRSYEERANR